MAILGILLLLGVVGAGVAIAWTNQDAITASAATLDVFGKQADLNVGQLFLLGAAAGALVVLALYMTVGGTRRRMSRSSQRRREMRERERELQAQLAEANAMNATRSAAGERTAAREERAAERIEAGTGR